MAVIAQSVERSFVVRKVKGSILFNRPEQRPPKPIGETNETSTRRKARGENKKRKHRVEAESRKKIKERLDGKKGKKKRTC